MTSLELSTCKQVTFIDQLGQHFTKHKHASQGHDHCGSVRPALSRWCTPAGAAAPGEASAAEAAALGAMLAHVILAHLPSLPEGFAREEAAALARWLADSTAGPETDALVACR